MSYTYLLGQGGESSAECYSDIPAYALSRLKNIQEKFCYKDSVMESCQDSLSGTTSEPLTVSPGKDMLISSVVDSLARIYRWQVKGLESQENGLDYGTKWRGLSVKYDRNTHLWRTHQCLFPEVLKSFCVILPKWGMMRDGELWERMTPGHLTRETESGLWPTPDANMNRETQAEWKPIRPSGQPAQYPLNQAVRDRPMWRTPAANELGVKAERLIPIEGGEPGGMNRHFDKETGRMAQIGLEQQVALRRTWPTPVASDGTTGAIIGKNDKFVELESGRLRKINQNGTAGSLGLARTIMFQENRTWNTPTSCEWKGRDPNSKQQGLTNDIGCTGGQLNPDWVEWLMGWPIGWTQLEPLKLDWRSWEIDPADIGEVPRTGQKIPNRANRLKAIGNGQVPAVAELAWTILTR